MGERLLALPLAIPIWNAADTLIIYELFANGDITYLLHYLLPYFMEQSFLRS